MDFGRVAVGGAVAALSVAVLEKIDPKLAWWFVVITFLTVIIVQREQFFSQLNYLQGLLRSAK